MVRVICNASERASAIAAAFTSIIGCPSSARLTVLSSMPARFASSDCDNLAFSRYSFTFDIRNSPMFLHREDCPSMGNYRHFAGLSTSMHYNGELCQVYRDSVYEMNTSHQELSFCIHSGQIRGHAILKSSGVGKSYTMTKCFIEQWLSH